MDLQWALRASLLEAKRQGESKMSRLLAYARLEQAAPSSQAGAGTTAGPRLQPAPKSEAVEGLHFPVSFLFTILGWSQMCDGA